MKKQAHKEGSSVTKQHQKIAKQTNKQNSHTILTARTAQNSHSHLGMCSFYVRFCHMVQATFRG